MQGKYEPLSWAYCAKAVTLPCWRNMRSAVALVASAPAVAHVSKNGSSGKASESHSATWNASRAASGIGSLGERWEMSVAPLEGQSCANAPAGCERPERWRARSGPATPGLRARWWTGNQD
eukprot:scaffold274353_cov30-Tisochrysis_lutea.AAC.5